MKHKSDSLETVWLIVLFILAALILAAGIYKEWLQFRVMLKYIGE